MKAISLNGLKTDFCPLVTQSLGNVGDSASCSNGFPFYSLPFPMQYLNVCCNGKQI